LPRPVFAFERVGERFASVCGRSEDISLGTRCGFVGRLRAQKSEALQLVEAVVHLRSRDTRPIANLAAFQFEPGQFAIWRFLDARRWWEAHPFSLSATPNDEYLRLTVKRDGDFGRHVGSIRAGTPVLVEGPFGRFTRASCTRPKALLIAGGIGITPIRALAEDLAGDGVDVCLLYRCSHESDVAFRHELTDLVARHGVRVEYLISDRALRGRPGGEWLLPNNLRTLVPDVTEREIFVCGPIGLTHKIRRSLDQLGVGLGQIHAEAFQF